MYALLADLVKRGPPSSAFIVVAPPRTSTFCAARCQSRGGPTLSTNRSPTPLLPPPDTGSERRVAARDAHAGHDRVGELTPRKEKVSLPWSAATKKVPSDTLPRRKNWMDVVLARSTSVNTAPNPRVIAGVVVPGR